MSSVLPSHACVVTAPDLWMEGSALEQLGRVARFDRCTRAVGMPDLHAGPGIPIGAAFAFEGVVRPLLVGGDAGCGVTVVGLPRLKGKVDAIERRVDAELRGPALPDAEPGALLAAAWRHGPVGLADVPGVPERFATLLRHTFARVCADGDVDPGPVPDAPELGRALGTIGGGNHFAEVSRVTGVADRATAKTVGLRPGAGVVMVHSGSRGLGRRLIDDWGDRVLEGPDQARYLRQLTGAVRFAQANRAVLVWRLLQALGAARPGRHGAAVDIVHNTVEQADFGEGERFVHRKGSAPAADGQLTVLLGSRGTPSFLLRGTGEAGCLCSIAHGAGRKMARGEAVEKLRRKYTRAGLRRTALGGRVLCDDRDLLYAEHPDAYKKVGPVLQATVDAGAATLVCALHPMVTVKR